MAVAIFLLVLVTYLPRYFMYKFFYKFENVNPDGMLKLGIISFYFTALVMTASLIGFITTYHPVLVSPSAIYTHDNMPTKLTVFLIILANIICPWLLEKKGIIAIYIGIPVEIIINLVSCFFLGLSVMFISAVHVSISTM